MCGIFLTTPTNVESRDQLRLRSKFFDKYNSIWPSNLLPVNHISIITPFQLLFVHQTKLLKL